MKKSFKKPNLNGPRFRPKRTTILNRALFEKFKKAYPEYDNLDLAMFKKIVKTFNKNLYEGVIDNREGIELPEGLGYIFLGTCPPTKKQNVDYAKSIEYGITANHKNWDSDNKLLKIFYTNYKSKYPLQNKQVWAFKAVKQFRKAASDAYKENWQKYIVVDSKQKVSAFFAKMRKKDYIISDSKIIPDGYDEFKM